MTCARGQAPSPAELADQIARGIYADDISATTAAFDDDLRKSVTRADLGALSDQMHAFGSYKGLVAKSADPDRGRYDFNLTFERGTLVAHLRIDPSGRVGAYRITTPR